jgi:predicted enzyme related to lactoylglutathione lyase
VDVSVDDVAKAVEFYQALFGWDIQAGGPDVGGYSLAHSNGRLVAGIGPKMGSPDQPSMWTTYLATEDADATATKIKAAGGQILQEPMDVMEQGRMAIATDPAGAVFGLWQSGVTKGIGLANEPGSLCWSEQLSGDLDGSKAFYQAVFGYEYQDMSGEGSAGSREDDPPRPPAGSSYAMLMIDGHEVGGIGLREGEGPAVWGTYLAVGDTDASLAQAQGLGGTVVKPVWDSEYGRMATLADDQGAIFSLVTAPMPR